MDHDVVVRDKMTERYLLNELDPEARDRFEEHFFDCPDCALDLRAATLFIEKSKVVLADEAAVSGVPALAVPSRRLPRWLAWLRPSIAAPALALLLAVVAYQNLVTVPHLNEALKSPRVLGWTAVNVGTFGSEGNVITVPPGNGFLLFIRIPPDATYSRYTLDLFNSAGKIEWSLPLPAAESQDQWPVQVPAADRQPGTYTVVLHGITPAGEAKEAGRASFELRFQK